MSRIFALALTCCTLGAGPVAAAPDATCTPLFDAARKAQTQPGIERTAVIGDPARPGVTVTARKTAAGWYIRRNDDAWQAMPIDPEAQERGMLDDGSAFEQCAAGATDVIAGEAARAWTYVTAGVPTTIWISVARGLPLKVQANGALQTLVYRPTPFPKP